MEIVDVEKYESEHLEDIILDAFDELEERKFDTTNLKDSISDSKRGYLILNNTRGTQDGFYSDIEDAKMMFDNYCEENKGHAIFLVRVIDKSETKLQAIPDWIFMRHTKDYAILNKSNIKDEFLEEIELANIRNLKLKGKQDDNK